MSRFDHPWTSLIGQRESPLGFVHDFECDSVTISFDQLQNICQDLNYIEEMKKMDQEISDRRSRGDFSPQSLEMTSVIPVSGLIMARVHVLECEIATVLEMWKKSEKSVTSGNVSAETGNEIVSWKGAPSKEVKLSNVGANFSGSRIGFQSRTQNSPLISSNDIDCSFTSSKQRSFSDQETFSDSLMTPLVSTVSLPSPLVSVDPTSYKESSVNFPNILIQDSISISPHEIVVGKVEGEDGKSMDISQSLHFTLNDKGFPTLPSLPPKPPRKTARILPQNSSTHPPSL